MEQYVPILLDVLVVVVIISMVKASARRGFVRTVIQFAGYLVSLGISSVVSRMAPFLSTTPLCGMGLWISSPATSKMSPTRRW